MIQKELNAKNAKTHIELCEKYFPQKIEECVKDTKIYGPVFCCNKPSRDLDTKIILLDDTSENAVKRFYHDGKIAVLNFASYKHPGGRFLDGSMAQEEALCHRSILYSVLSRIPEYYEWNNKNKNNGLYTNRALYTPNVLFNQFESMQDLYEGDVITCAAPNFTAGLKYRRVSYEMNQNELIDRITFVLEVAKDNEVDTLILGAFGCGVFGQSPDMVANIFKDRLLSTHFRCFNKVVFAVPFTLSPSNYMAFKKVFEGIDFMK